jgi:hypothetical protein
VSPHQHIPPRGAVEVQHDVKIVGRWDGGDQQMFGAE